MTATEIELARLESRQALEARQESLWTQLVKFTEEHGMKVTVTLQAESERIAVTSGARWTSEGERILIRTKAAELGLVNVVGQPINVHAPCDPYQMNFYFS